MVSGRTQTPVNKAVQHKPDCTVRRRGEEEEKDMEEGRGHKDGGNDGERLIMG